MLMMLGCAALVALVLVAAAPGAARRRGRRLRSVVETVHEQPGRRWLASPLLALPAAVALFIGIGGLAGLLIGAGAGYVIVVAGRFAARPKVARAVPEDVPVVIELLAGCLAAGLAMPEALDAASVAGDPVTAHACRAAAAALRRGAAPAEAWQSWLGDPSLSPVARTTVRTTHSGAAAADELRRLAVRLRAQRRALMQHRVRQAGIWVVVPLGLCFLPAFVLVAVVPLVVGLFTTLR